MGREGFELSGWDGWMDGKWYDIHSFVCLYQGIMKRAGWLFELKSVVGWEDGWVEIQGNEYVE